LIKEKKMKKILFLIITVISGMLLSSCEADNYAEPDGALTGELIDAVTQKPYISQQPDGFEIRCTILGWEGDENTGAQKFWGKANGTFNNDKIFAGTYRVVPMTGGFHPIEADTVEIRSKQVTVHSFTVTPYVSISDVSIEKDPDVADGIIMTFSIHTNTLYEADGVTVKSKATFASCKLFASKRTNKVGSNANDGDITLSAVTGVTDEPQTFTVKRKGFEAGNTYYLRIGARCSESPTNGYNMTEIVELQF
jgi:hypothetical protein